MCGKIERRKCPHCNKSFIAFPVLQQQYLMDKLWLNRRHYWYSQCPQCRIKESRPESEWEALRIGMKNYTINQLEHRGMPPDLIKAVLSSENIPNLMID